MTNLVLPGTLPHYSHWYMAQFNNENTIMFEQAMTPDIVTWLMFTIADDLLQPNPVTHITRIDWVDGMERFFFFGTNGQDNVRAKAYFCGVHPLQVRAVCHHLVATSLQTMNTPTEVESEPKSGLVIPGQLRIVQ